MTVGVADPLGLWPAAVQIRWADGAIVDWAPAAKADVTLPLGALGAWWVGDLSLADLAILGWAEGDVASLPSPFQRHIPYRYLFDQC